MEKKDETKGRMFTKGGRPGPGRPKRSAVKRMTFDEIEALLQQDLRAKDYRVRHNATKLLIALRKQAINTGGAPVIDPAIEKLLGERLSWLLDDGDTEDGEIIDPTR